MYERFPSWADELRMQTFHTASWPEHEVLDETFGRKILYFGNPNALSADPREKLEA